MPSREHSFRLGKIAYADNLPPLASISVLINTGIRGRRGDRQGIRRIEYDESADLLYMVYIKETSTNYVALDDDNKDQEQQAYPRRAMKIILADNGTYLYESVQGVSDAEALGFLSSQIDQNLEIDEYGAVPRSVMLDFFNNKLNRVKKFKVDEIGDHEPNPGPIRQWLREIIDEFGNVIEIQENSVGRDPNADARDDDLAYALAETSDPDVIRGEDEDGRTEELNSSGIYRVRYDDEDLSPEQEAELVTRKVDRVFEDVLGNNAANQNRTTVERDAGSEGTFDDEEERDGTSDHSGAYQDEL